MLADEFTEEGCEYVIKESERICDNAGNDDNEHRKSDRLVTTRPIDVMKFSTCFLYVFGYF